MILILFSVGISMSMYAQRVAISTDALKWATIAPNISFDIALSSKLSLNIEGAFNPYDNIFKNLSTKQITLSPELRYWFKRPLHSHYLGVNILASIYDLKIKEDRKKGQTLAIGIGYGYSLIVSRRISFTPIIGIGCGYVLSYADPELNEQSPIEGGFKFMLTRIGITFSYITN